MTNSWRAACRYSYIASTTEPLNQELRRPLTSTAILSSFPVARLEAAREMEKDSSSAAASTRSRVASLTSDDPRSARETVATETPAKSATSCMLDRSFRAAPLYVSVGPVELDWSNGGVRRSTHRHQGAATGLQALSRTVIRITSAAAIPH